MAKCAGVDLSTQAQLAIGTVLKNQKGNQLDGVTQAARSKKNSHGKVITHGP